MPILQIRKLRLTEFKRLAHGHVCRDPCLCSVSGICCHGWVSLEASADLAFGLSSLTHQHSLTPVEALGLDTQKSSHLKTIFSFDWLSNLLLHPESRSIVLTCLAPWPLPCFFQTFPRGQAPVLEILATGCNPVRIWKDLLGAGLARRHELYLFQQSLCQLSSAWITL